MMVNCGALRPSIPLKPFVPTTNGSSRRLCRQICCADSSSSTSRRDFILNSSSIGVLSAIFGLPLPPGPRPSGLGLSDYGEGNKQLSLCSKPKTCISTAEAANNDSNYVPPWTYNPTIGKAKKRKLSPEEAMTQLKQVVSILQPDGYKPEIIRETSDYLYVEYKSPTLGFIDDVEFYINGSKSEVEYRSASRWGSRDFDVNRKRIRAIRKELEKEGWVSVGF